MRLLDFCRYVVEALAQADEPTRFPAFHKVSTKKMTLEFYHDSHAMERVKTSCQSLGWSDNVCRQGIELPSAEADWLVCCQDGGFCGQDCWIPSVLGVRERELHTRRVHLPSGTRDSRSSEHLQRRKLPPLAGQMMIGSSCLSQILSALDEMHRCGIVHGKLMPSNIVRFDSKKGVTWKVTGMSCPFHTGDFEQRFLRSGYAAPEVVRATEAERGATKVGPESDMWSFGLISYECFTGDSFVEGATPTQLLCLSNR